MIGRARSNAEVDVKLSAIYILNRAANRNLSKREIVGKLPSKLNEKSNNNLAQYNLKMNPYKTNELSNYAMI